MFFLLYKRADDAVFDDFPKISDHFPKIYENYSEGLANDSENFPNISQRFPKIAEGDRRCFDHTPTNLSVLEGTRQKCCQT